MTRWIVVLLLYVLPLAATVVFLVAVDLAVIAVALVAVEAVVVAAVLWARRGRGGRRPMPQHVGRGLPGGRSRTRREGWGVLAGLLAVVVGTLALAVVGARLG